MSRKTKKKAVSKDEREELQSSPDLTSDQAKSSLVEEILQECIKLEEGRIRTVFPLCKLVGQYKELQAQDA